MAAPQPLGEASQQRCEVCGNRYHRPIEVIVEGTRHLFDSFECAIEALAPRCGHCGCRVIGHGVEEDRTIFCCDHCRRRGQDDA